MRKSPKVALLPGLTLTDVQIEIFNFISLIWCSRGDKLWVLLTSFLLSLTSTALDRKGTRYQWKIWVSMIYSQKEISIGHFGAMDDSNIHHHLISISLWHFSNQLSIFQFSIFGQFLTGSAIVFRSKLAAIFARGRFNRFLWLSATFSTSLLSASEAWCLQKKSLRSRHGLYNGFDSKTTLKSVHFPYFKSKKTPAFCCCLTCSWHQKSNPPILQSSNSRI